MMSSIGSETSLAAAAWSVGGMRKSRSLAPFLSKTYDLIGECGAPQVVSWNEEGTGFVVWSPEDFSQSVLPRYFKHCNFSSFIRQLNTYGFKKSATDRWEFRHEKFQKGRRHLLAEISRRKCKPSAFPTFLKPCEETETERNSNLLLEENRLLEKKNSELQSQIVQYKELEVQLRNWLSQYS